MSLPDTIFIFALALVIFGPKRLPEIGRQIGKLVFEFRRASNEFKLQIEEELRTAELAEKQKKLTAAPVAEAAVLASPKEAMMVRPPSTGDLVSTEGPSRVVPVEEEVATLKDVSAESPLAATAAEGLENARAPVAPDATFDEAPALMESVSPEFPALASSSAAGTEAQLETNTVVPAANEEAAADDTVSPANLAATGSRQEAVRSAEEHIREQIAIHHG